MKTFLISTFMFILLAFSSTDKLTGKWESKLPDGSVLGIKFKPNKSMEGYFNKKPIFSGTYSLQGSRLSFKDNGCQGIEGIYKVKFFSNSDSIHWKVINDGCPGRRQGMNNLILGRVK